MDSALKQRLVGAAVLVALAVIFLPMLLDRPAPESGAGDVSLDVPAAPEREMETRELPLTPPTADPGPVAPPQLDDDPNRVTTVDAVVTKPADVRPEDDAATPVAPNDAPLPRDLASDAAAARETPPAPPPPVAGAGRYAVQLGTFGNADNAAALRRKVEAAGLPVSAEAVAVGGKPATRLRAGPFADRGAAERARLAVARVEAGLKAEVIALDAESAPAPAPAAARTGFAVQVAALRSRSDAEALRDRLRAGGVSAYIDEAPAEGGQVFRVRAGPEVQRDRAEALQASIRQKFQLDGIVVTHP